MSIKSKLKTFFFLDEEFDGNEDIVEEVQPVRQPKPAAKPQNVVSLQSVQKSSKVVLVEPRTYSQATEIADHLKNRRAVVVNLQRIDSEQGRQIVDFLSGAVYTISGEIQKIGEKIFLCTPDNVEVSGNITEALVKESEFQDTRW
ncbi:cell division protein SepF [Bacillus salipaludis]|uniref:Cell division protein SepF n=1 Tax=Bacillus salipaludis TaxID=2547811 RepID=A0A4R5W1G7_9BACI|nr:cell division protein SepF [Bacillus salipaludis]MDQ6596884.1 cell division protein SepF [Bacillus salipaludis]TDK64904.1 cell division protein SepF [Bacillus salipaludis]